MTTLHKVHVKCANCGSGSDQTVVMSSNAFGSPDLDTRPPEMVRSTLVFSVQCCPSCGYCASDLSDTPPENVDEVLLSADYEDLLKFCDMPQKAIHFRCQSMIYAHDDKFNGAGWACVRAAWVCDDADDREGAISARLEAIRHFKRATAEGQKFMTNANEEDILRIDLMRRAEQFDRALELCAVVLEDEPAGLLGEIAAYQKRLIEAQDTAAHRIEDARNAP